jgi:large subunit ribosomal protein L29
MSIKIKELKSTGVEDLKDKMTELKKQLMKDYTQVSTGTTPKSPGQIRAAKKTIARILTILKEKNQEEA